MEAFLNVIGKQVSSGVPSHHSMQNKMLVLRQARIIPQTLGIAEVWARRVSLPYS